MPEDAKVKATSARLQLVDSDNEKVGDEFTSIKSRINEITRAIENRKKETRSLESTITRAEINGDGHVIVPVPNKKKRKQRSAAVRSRKKTREMFDEESDGSESSEDELETSNGNERVSTTFEDAR